MNTITLTPLSEQNGTAHDDYSAVAPTDADMTPSLAFPIVVPDEQQARVMASLKANHEIRTEATNRQAQSNVVTTETIDDGSPELHRDDWLFWLIIACGVAGYVVALGWSYWAATRGQR
jgi:hypothetical protein